ncbi:YbdD/YjiX family protein [Methylobacter sp. BlB1]|uniref:YbdD/YjiX family protein n=1 Tax=Methylobacter sp. BlB1 TaxID=2785914 RepID=UPI001E2EA785|nr:YbdD/YjiX family protein [Methylobacter sp. BlB1]
MGARLMISRLKSFWQIVRHLSGDDAYERYLKHHAMHHQADSDHVHCQPLSKKEFFKQWQDEKWRGVKRCC